MKNYKQLTLMNIIISIVSLALIGCIGSINPVQKVPSKSSIVESIDSCKINVLNKAFYKEYNCPIYSYWVGDRLIFADSNKDYTTIVYPVTHNANLTVFECYDSPTGRRKLLLFDLSGRRILLSEWFDNSALGDSVDIKSINSSSFDVQRFDQKGKHYNVKFILLKAW